MKKIPKYLAKGMMILGSVGVLGTTIATVANLAAPSQVLLRQAEGVSEQKEEARSSLVDCLRQRDEADCSTLAGQYATLDEELLRRESTPAYQDAQGEQNQLGILYGTTGVVSLLLLMGGYFAHEKRKLEQRMQQKNNQIEEAISTDIESALERIKEQKKIYNPQELSAHLDALEGKLLEQGDNVFKEWLKEDQLKKNDAVSKQYGTLRIIVQRLIAEKKRSLYN
ncbi:MAG: hypothetical protein Q8R53_02855 [Nanoarchaeota archaeon]|nr:hypothetical protein [Nanoarchaeota archaeon]